jgi:hypothetical protein
VTAEICARKAALRRALLISFTEREMKADSPAPKVNVHNPSITDRFAFVVPEDAATIPVRLKRVYCPSPKLPTRKSPLNRPKANDAPKRPVVDTSAGAAAKIRAASGYS